MKEGHYIVFRDYGFVKSFVSACFTFGFLIFCIYISQGSVFWTFTTGSIFLIVLWAKVAVFTDDRRHAFNSKEDLIAWAESLPDN